jgi:hypothetical protein
MCAFGRVDGREEVRWMVEGGRKREIEAVCEGFDGGLVGYLEWKIREALNNDEGEFGGDGDSEMADVDMIWDDIDDGSPATIEESMNADDLDFIQDDTTDIDDMHLIGDEFTDTDDIDLIKDDSALPRFDIDNIS